MTLAESALAARLHACCDYSGFHVGAALEDASGKVWTGCNVENATYGLTVCAERVALWKALSEGVREFRRLAIGSDSEELTPPCGACRQLLWEFCGDIEVTLVSPNGKQELMTLASLLPRPFGDRFFR